MYFFRALFFGNKAFSRKYILQRTCFKHSLGICQLLFQISLKKAQNSNCRRGAVVEEQEGPEFFFFTTSIISD